VATFAGTVYRFDQQSGEIARARRARATSAPAFIDGALYFSHRADDEPSAAAPHRRRAQESIVRSQKGGSPGDQPAGETPARDAEYLDYELQQDTVHGQMSVEHDAANGFGAGAPAAANAGVARQLVGRSSVYGLQEFQGSWVLGLGDANYSSMGDSLVCIDRQTGEDRWTVRLPGDLRRLGGVLAPPPAAAGDQVVVATLTGNVLVIDSSNGEVARRLEVGAPVRSQPIIDRGWVYVGTADGQLVGLDTGDPTLSGWPAWAGNPARTGIPTGS
jgi:hypothetical protein